MHVLVVGGTGLVGSHVVDHAVERSHEVSWTYLTGDVGDADTDAYRLDKTDADAADALLAALDPDAVVDAAAFVDVDACETDRDRAWTVNVTGTRNVAAAAASIGAHYLTLSTDYVFPGDPTAAPYTVGDPVAPTNYYGVTKYAAEGATRIADEWTILRTSVVYGDGPANFVTWAHSELDAGNEIGIVDDQVSTPTYAPDLAQAAVAVVEGTVTGLYHATGPRSLSRYAFTQRLAEAYGYDPALVTPITTEELGQVAPRPTDGSLDSTPLYERLGWTFHTPREAFKAMRERA
jgi:dTDP-4-dehydrorhamnose reductase